MEKDHSGLFIVAIVGIVAVVGVLGLIMTSMPREFTPNQVIESAEGDSAGQVIQMVDEGGGSGGGGTGGTTTTTSAPVVTILTPTDIVKGSTTVTLQAKINPGGLPTEYFFEYGYMYSIDETPLGTTPITTITTNLNTEQTIKLRVSGMKIGSDNKVRIWARNSKGTIKSVDLKFEIPETDGSIPGLPYDPSIAQLYDPYVASGTVILRAYVPRESPQYYFAYSDNIFDLVGGKRVNTPLKNNNPDAVNSDIITTLKPNTTYYYFVMPSNKNVIRSAISTIDRSINTPSAFTSVKTAGAKEGQYIYFDFSEQYNMRLYGYLTYQDQVSYKFEYGPTNSMGLFTTEIQTSPEKTLLERPVQVTIKSLKPNVLYYYRLIGTQRGKTLYGETKTSYINNGLPIISGTNDAGNIKIYIDEIKANSLRIHGSPDAKIYSNGNENTTYQIVAIENPYNYDVRVEKIVVNKIIPAGQSILVDERITGLRADTEYMFYLNYGNKYGMVATNEKGFVLTRTSKAVCGNGIIETPTETCDGAPTQTCASAGYSSGSMKCTQCQNDFTGCISKGGVLLE